LDSDAIDSIVANLGYGRTLDICYHEADPDDFKDNSARSRFKKWGLITFDKETLSEDGKPCVAGSRTKYNAAYDETRNYLISVLKNVNFSRQ
jgi:hypothetical protein